MKISFFTVHDATSPRKVDFHFWAEELVGKGIDVDFITVGFSPLTHLKRSGRRYQPPFNEWQDVRSHITNDDVENVGQLRRYLWRAPFHPMGAGALLNKALDGIFSLYPNLMPRKLLTEIADSDICIVENGAGLLLVPRLKSLMPKAKFIYNVCDRIETLGYHPSILRAENTALKIFDKIRVPAQVMENDFATQGVGTKAVYIPHGLHKTAFDAPVSSPYKSEKNVVSVGDMLFDADTVRLLAEKFPDWTFHLFGRKSEIPSAPKNIIIYGERPFDFIIPYIKHADIGLAPYRRATNADYLSQSSMKMIQYTYCQLPILAPIFASTGRAHVCAYDLDDTNSLERAMNKAITYDRSTINISTVMGWAETIECLLSFDTEKNKAQI